MRNETIFVRDFSRIGAERNYDEVDVRFFLDFLRFGGGGGFCARDPYLHTHGGKVTRELAKWLTRATQPGLVSPGGGEQAQRHHPASLSSESGESLRHVGCNSAKGR
jgi:hypothetical protein